jgi:predicted NBD/HSP70 family sugar kinase
MYMGVDIGGTKTLVAVLDKHGVIIEHSKFPTSPDYSVFLEDLKKSIASLKTKDFAAGAVGIPAVNIDREHGVGVVFGNLAWRNVPIMEDVEAICGCPFAVENDAKLAALSEAMLLKDTYKKVLYVTISTGIGLGLVSNGAIDINIGDGGGRTILLEHDGKIMPWEDFAGGRAIVTRYGKKAEDITDTPIWEAIARDLAKGFIHLIALLQPEVIVIGGSVGTYFPRYGQLLSAEIKKYQIPLLTLPLLIEAQRPEEAVVYGCYDLARQIFPHAKTD